MRGMLYKTIVLDCGNLSIAALTIYPVIHWGYRSSDYQSNGYGRVTDNRFHSVTL